MNNLPTPEGSPAPVQEDTSQVGRKRQRSQSMESDASSSSLKRPLANPGPQDTNIRSPKVDQMSTLSLTDSNLGVDAYMAEQGEEELEKATIVDQPHVNSVKNLPPKEKWALVEEEVKKPLKVGDTWYLVERGWWKKWEKACSGQIDKEGPVSEQDLGPLDNTRLLDTYGNLQLSLLDGVDLEFVPEETWQHFIDWYGEPIKPLPRRVIERGLSKQATIELRPPTLNVLRLSATKTNKSLKKITISAGETVKTLNAQLAMAASPSADQQLPTYRVWKINPPEDDVISIEFLPAELSTAEGKLVQDSEKTLEDEGVQAEDWFVVEFQNDGSWLAQETASGATSSPSTSVTAYKAPTPLFNSSEGFFNKGWKSASKDESSDFKVVKKNAFVPKEREIEPGTLGLGNMGNTCFMNSAIQCLAHNKELSDYFLTGLFKDELNPDNPLGMGGAIAESFGSLLHRIWAKTAPSYSYSPRDFKMQLQRFAPQFSGYQQHDSQELVAFLLDGLHEDLNRVLKKPYVEKPDWEGGNDVDLVNLAKESWDGYMRRNDSVIVDLFQGQYQSTLVCPECNKVSITFDPFMYLTLPLPIQKKWKHKIYYIPWDLEKPHLIVPVEINGNSTFKELRALLGRYMEAPPENLLTLEIFSHKFYKNLDDNTMVGDMANNDIIVCFELPCNAQQNRTYKRQPGDPVLVPVYLIDAAGPSSSRFYSAKTGFGYPFIMPVYEENAKDKDAIYDLIVDRLQRWTRNARDLFKWEEGPISDVAEVNVNANGFPPVADSITEIKENGEVVTVQAPEPQEEGDIVDEKAMVLDEDSTAPPATEVLQPQRVGFKRDLFNLRLQPNQKEFGTASYSRYDSKGYESWADRMTAVGPDAPLIKEGDALYCEFDENVKAYYFGDERKWEHALWETWETFEHPEYVASKKGAGEKAKKGLNLKDCLEEFTKEEQLGEDDLWYCPQCKKHQPATKKFQLWTTPDILVVHLKRFSNNRSLRDKIDAFIDFPIEGLDLSDYVGERATAKTLEEQGVNLEELQLTHGEEPLLYDLFAVDEHIGGLGGGHYRAYALNHTNEKWYHFDDSHVTPAKPEEAVNANAYLLFYRRRTSEPLGGKSHHKIEEARAKAEAAAANADADATRDDDSQDMKVDPQLPTPPNDDPIANRAAGKLWNRMNADFTTGGFEALGRIPINPNNRYNQFLPPGSMDDTKQPEAEGEGDPMAIAPRGGYGPFHPDYSSMFDHSKLSAEAEGEGQDDPMADNRYPHLLPDYSPPDFAQQIRENRYAHLPDFSSALKQPEREGEDPTHKMMLPDYSMFTMPGFRSFEDAFPMGGPMGRLLRGDLGENDSEQDSTQASDYPDPSVNVSPSSSNAAEIDPDDLDDLDEDWEPNVAEDDTSPKPLPSRSNIVALKQETEANASQAKGDDEVTVQVEPVTEKMEGVDSEKAKEA